MELGRTQMSLQTRTQERDNIRNELNDLENRLKKLKGKSLLRIFTRNKKINDLKNGLSFIRGVLVVKNQQIDNLNNQVNLTYLR
jgi:hypothetical protein